MAEMVVGHVRANVQSIRVCTVWNSSRPVGPEVSSSIARAAELVELYGVVFMRVWPFSREPQLSSRRAHRSVHMIRLIEVLWGDIQAQCAAVCARLSCRRYCSCSHKETIAMRNISALLKSWSTSLSRSKHYSSWSLAFSVVCSRSRWRYAASICCSDKPVRRLESYGIRSFLVSGGFMSVWWPFVWACLGAAEHFCWLQVILDLMQLLWLYSDA